MIIDVHCHLGYTAVAVDHGIERFSFEPEGGAGGPGYDSYMSPRMLSSLLWRIVKRWLRIPANMPYGPELDAVIERINLDHLLDAPSVDRFVMLAFDEYYHDDGTPGGPIPRGADVVGTDLFTSNSYCRAWCRRHPEKFLFAASVHPYRRRAIEALEEVAAGGAVLMKWLPVHMNIDPRDPRVEAFLRRAGELGLPMLVHYGGEGALRENHSDQMNPQPMLDLLARIERSGTIPPMILAHLATPTFPWESGRYTRYLAEALLGRFRDAPVYADISAQTNKRWWLSWMLRRPELFDKLVYGSDFPIPAGTWAYPIVSRRGGRDSVLASKSWAEQSLRLVRRLGVPEGVLERGHEILSGRMG